MGNFASIHHHPRHTSIVLLYDGSTREFEDPPTVAELMLDHPQHVVVEFRSAVDGTRRPTALPADKTLEAKKLYIMLPMMNKLRRHNHRSSNNMLPRLSADESRRFLSMANSALRSHPYSSKRKVASFVPVLARVCANAKDQLSGEQRSCSSRGAVASKRAEEEEERRVPELREVMSESSNGMAMMSRQFSGKAWRPSLEAIAEKVEVKAKAKAKAKAHQSSLLVLK